ncbi:MAG: adenosylcobinamide-GDP ribazoletransferase [Bradyrhizobiaceae bacterium]|nr:adenosylcobinamide-GDP ribazoletransferase [Bradyrhizobiaceae bacterium]
MPPPVWLRDIVSDLKAALQFSTRLPMSGWLAGDRVDFARMAWAIPIAGAIVGLIGSLVYALVRALGLAPVPSAALSLVATMLTTGCLHEDGLADAADGFGGGGSRDEKLEIMHDSRVGTYGTCALILSVLLRTSAIASIATPALVTPALIAAHAASRATMPLSMWLVPPARADGLSAAAGSVSLRSVGIAGALGLAALVLVFGITAGVVLTVLLLLVIGGMARLCIKQIGGQTGDVLGALEQVSEIIILLAAAVR